MTEFNEAKMNGLLSLLSANGIKIQKEFGRVMDADFSDDPSKYELVCKAIERINFLAFDCVNHGTTRDKQKDILELSECCVKLTQPMKSKKVDGYRSKISLISSKVYVEKNSVDVRGDLLRMIRDTASGLKTLVQNDPKAKRASFYKEIERYLSELADKISDCYDNYSVEAADCSRKIFETVFKKIRLPLGAEILTPSEFRELKVELDATVEAWCKLLRAGKKAAKIEETYGFDPTKADAFVILVKVNDFLEKLDILEEKVEDYREQTELLCGTADEEKEREDLNARIAAHNAELVEIKAKTQNKKMTVDEAIVKAKQINANITRAKQRLEIIGMKISSSETRKDSRIGLYSRMKEVTKIIEASRTNPSKLFIYTQLLDLQKITQLLSGTATSDEELRAQITEVLQVLRADYESAVKEAEAKMKIDAITIDTATKLNDELEKIQQKTVARTTVVPGGKAPEKTEEEKMEEFNRLMKDVPAPEVAEETEATDDLDELLKTK